jgi:hypothetical protein
VNLWIKQTFLSIIHWNSPNSGRKITISAFSHLFAC